MAKDGINIGGDYGASFLVPPLSADHKSHLGAEILPIGERRGMVVQEVIYAR